MEAFLDVNELQATARHIELIDAKIEKLSSLRAESWTQLLTAAHRMYRSRRFTEADLLRLFDSMKASYGPGFTAVWNEHMPIQANRMPRWRIDLPNGPGESWLGEIPIGSNSPSPPFGVAVVYVLFDGANEPVYVGSTDAFRARISSHRREKPEARRWTAHRCRDREHAFQVEDRLLREHMPRMNKRRGR